MTDIQGTTLDGIRYETYASPSFTTLICHMAQNQAITAEKGAMMYMHRTIELQTHTRGGIMKSLKASMLGGESFFVNTFTAVHGHGDIAFVGPGLGDIKPIEIQNRGYIVQKTAFLCSSVGVQLDTKWQGFKGAFAEGSFFMLYANGYGTLFVSSFGAIIEKQLQQGEVLSVDNGHLVAWPEGMPYQVRRVGGMKSTLLSGEGLVVDLTGPGLVLLQSRNIAALAAQLVPFMQQR